METKFDMTRWGYIKDKLLANYPELTNANLNWGRVSSNDLLEMFSNKRGKLSKTQKELLHVINSF